MMLNIIFRKFPGQYREVYVMHVFYARRMNEYTTEMAVAEKHDCEYYKLSDSCYCNFSFFTTYQ